MLASAGTVIPAGPEWAHEIKWDGMRVLADVAGGRLRLSSRNENAVTSSFPELSTLTAIAMTGSVGMTGVVYQFLSGLAADIDALESDPTADALGERSADLIATLIQSQFGMP